MDDADAQYLHGQIAALETAFLCALGLIETQRLRRKHLGDTFSAAADMLGRAMPEPMARAEAAGDHEHAKGFEARMERIIMRLRRGDVSATFDGSPGNPGS